MFHLSVENPKKFGVLTNPELICHVAKTFNVLSPAFHEVQLAIGTTLEHLKEVRAQLSLTHFTHMFQTTGLLVAISTTKMSVAVTTTTGLALDFDKVKGQNRKTETKRLVRI